MPDHQREPDDPTTFFWDLADQFLADEGTEVGQLMRFPCLRRRGAFFATCDHRTGQLIVKLPRSRVAELIDDGLGQPFAPAGRVFEEWVTVPGRDADRWHALIAEACVHADAAATA